MRPLATLLIGALLGCSSSASDRPAGAATQTVRIVEGTGAVRQITTDATRGTSTATVAVTADDAWRVLPAVYQALGLSIDDLDTGARFLGSNTRLRGRLGGVRLSHYLDCGRAQGGPSADTYDVYLLIQTRVAPGELRTSRLSTLIDASARPATFAANPVRCTTTGMLERRIFEEIHARAIQTPESSR